MPVGGVVDLAEAPAERHLRFGIQPEPRKHQHTVFLERIEHRFTQQVIACQPVGVVNMFATTKGVSSLAVAVAASRPNRDHA